jgi:hypothetical protein
MKTCSEMMVEQIKLMNDRDWDVLYVAVDLHGTIINNIDYNDFELYDYAKSVLQWMSDNDKIVLIINTSTYIDDRFDFMCTMYNDHDIEFSYHNGNPEVRNTETGDFSEKFYYNILLDDRAGFDPLNDWFELNENLKMFEELMGD